MIAPAPDETIIAPPSRLDEYPIVTSWTAWQRWKLCHAQEGLFRAGIPRAPQPRRRFLVGTVVHKCLEFVVRHHGIPTNRYVYDTFVHEASKGVMWRGPGDARELLIQTVNVVQALGPYVLRLVRTADGPVKAECELRVPVRFDPNNPESELFYMAAKMDLWAVLGATHVIVDYKSGSSGSADVRQMHWYAAVWSLHASRAIVSHPPKGRFLYVSPSRDTEGSIDVREVHVTRDDMRNSIASARALALAIQGRVYPPSPHPGKCSNCRLRVSCPASAYSPVANGRSLAR